MIAGRYTLVREIGRGGMGAVWLGRDEVLGRQVALKLVGGPSGADADALTVAEHEARLAARLNHPHVVAVFDFVVDPDSQERWLVMEHVPGGTLQQLVAREGPLAVDDAAALVRQAAEGLAAAHAVGIVHRDVKPSNILLGDGVVKLTDFGIARLLDDASTTRTGMVKGSPAYLAPEVASGGRGDAASDVWSLGATTYFVLAGRAPYAMDGNVLGGLYRIVNEEPPPLPEAGWLAPLLTGTLVKDPTQRWTVRQVLHFLEHRTPSDTGEPATRLFDGAGAPVDRPARPSGRTRAPWLVAALALVALAGVALAVGLRHDPGPTRASDPGAAATSPTAAPSTSATPSPTTRPTPGPSSAGMTAFVRRYVAAIGSDPARAWTMLTPAFQRQSGGRATYVRFWSGVGTPHLLSVVSDPERLVVSYQVRFEHFGTGKRPTVVKLAYRDGRYRIAGESTTG